MLRPSAADCKKYGGKLEKYIGDAIMAVFGVPLSHENDPEMALLLPDFSMFWQKLMSLLLNGLRGLRN